LQLELLESRELLAGTFTPLTNLSAGVPIGTQVVLPDGRILVDQADSQLNFTISRNWYTLTPDATGSYINGTWSAPFQSSVGRTYFSSSVLPTGKVLVLGGILTNFSISSSFLTRSYTPTGELFDPSTNSFTSITPFPLGFWGLAGTEVLDNGTLLAGFPSSSSTWTYNPAADPALGGTGTAWTQTGTKLNNDTSAFESFVKLPDGSILTYSLNASLASGVPGFAQRYIQPGTPAAAADPAAVGTWVETGPVPVALGGSDLVGGPAFLLPSGQVIQIGGNSNTALYDPTTDTWVTGPTIPGGYGMDGANGVEMPDGNVLFVADQPFEAAPSALFLYNPNDLTQGPTGTITQITPPGSLATDLTTYGAYVPRLQLLPTGDVLISDGVSTQLWDYNPGDNPGPGSSAAPTITNLAAGGPPYTLTGTQFTGIDEAGGAGLGAQATNYPLVQFTSTTNGNVYYGTTSNWNLTGVVNDGATTMQFTLPAGIPNGSYNLTVIANGISSDPYPINIFNGEIGLSISPSTLPHAQDAAAYSQTITASRGKAPYTFSVIAGNLPTGLTLSPGGVLSGTPTEGGSFTFTVRVTDSTKPVPEGATQTYTLVVDPPSFTFNPAGAFLPNATDAVAYSTTISATGGILPDSLALAGPLPSGLTFTPGSGVLSGTPTEWGTFTIDIAVKDSSGSAFGGHGPYTVVHSYTLIIKQPNIVVAPGSPLPPGKVGVGYSQNVVATGGVAPYDYEIGAGLLPGGMILNPITGVLSGTPTEAGPFNFTVSVTDSSGTFDGGNGPFTVNKNYALFIAAPTITLSPSSLPAGTTAISYRQTVTAAGGTSPYVYSLSAGTLPAGLTFNSAGLLSGTPTAAGSYNFTVKVVDSTGGTGPYSQTINYNLFINPPNITVNPTGITPGQVAVAYNQTFTATGGTPSYTFTTAGPLPTGLTLSPSGVLSGTPTDGGTFVFTVVATDKTTGTGPYTGSTQYTLIVSPPSLVISPADVPLGSDGVPYNVTLSMKGGTAPYTLSLSSGLASLPHGLTFVGGVISGTPTDAGVFNFTVHGTDSSGGSGPYSHDWNFQLTINAPTIRFSPATLPQAQVASTFSQDLTPSGGTTPYTNYVVSKGVLPPGLTLSPTGTISGIPTTAGLFGFNVSVTDSSGGTGPFTEGQSFLITVQQPTITFTPGTLPDAPIGGTYSQTITAAGGFSPYSGFALNSGRLPNGLTLSPTGVLSGTATETGTFFFTIGAHDSSPGGPYPGTASYQLVVDAPTVVVNPAGLPPATVGSFLSQQLSGSGGTAPYSTFVVTSGAMPPGLSLTLGGLLSGTPSGGGNFTFTVRAQDSTSGKGPYTGTTTYSMTVSPPVITLSPSSLGTMTVGVAVNQPITVTGGIAPYGGFAVSGVGLPPGITLSPGGVLQGTPTAGGTYTFTVTAHDSSQNAGPYSGSQFYAVTVAAPNITLGPSPLPAATVGSAFSTKLTAAGGTAPYSNFTLTGGAQLPAGLSLASDGTLSGTATAGGTFTFSVQTQDASGGSGPYLGTGNYTLVVNPPNMVISPASLGGGAVGVSFLRSLSAAAGTAPYTFSLAAGQSLPPGITLAADGTLSGTPTAGGPFTFKVQARDSSSGSGPYTGTATYTVNIQAPTLTFGPTLQAATIGASYTQSLTVSGGTGPYVNFVLASGSQLPAGLSLLPSGTIVGTPTAGGIFSFSVQASDSSTGTGPYTGTGNYNLTVNAPTITFTPTMLVNPTVGVAYSQPLAGVGGTAPYKNFTVTGNSTMPPGLTLSPGGTISGTPTAGGVYTITVQASDSSTGTGPFTGSASYTLAVASPTIVISPATLSPAQIGANYSQTLTVAGGTAPYGNFTLVVPGSLPGGLTLSPAGVISGIPNVGGSFNIAVHVQDSSGGTGPYAGIANYTVLVAAPTIVLTPGNLPSATILKGYSQQLSAGGGTAPYSNFLLAGNTQLPAGLHLTTGGTIVGTPTVTGTFNFTVQVSDASGGAGPYTGTQPYTLTVNPPPIGVAPPSLANPTVGISYTQLLFGVGGVAPYSNFTLTSGSLPLGITLSPTGTLSGTPHEGGPFSFTIATTDSSTGTGPYTGSTNFNLTVNAPTITVGPASLASATVAGVYNQTLSASGGTAPYVNFRLLNNTTLPAGLTLSPAGVISGTPTAGGTFNITVAATDSSGGVGPYSGSTNYALVVKPPTVVVSPSALSGATIGALFSQQLSVSGGTAPYGTFTLAGGKLPAGIQLSSSGLLSGTPTAGGPFNFTVSVTDSSGGTGPYTGSTNYTLTVAGPTITVGPATLAAGAIGASYNATVTASGGIAPFGSYALAAGSALPAGLTLSPGGVITGTPTAGGPFSFTIVATDSSTGAGPYTGGSTITMTVNAPTISITPAALPQQLLYVNNPVVLTATGGTAAYVFTLLGGTLPPGMTLEPDGTLDGAPTKTGTYTFTAQATDASTGTGPFSGTQAYSLTVATPTVTISPKSISAAQVGVLYNQTFTASGANAPYRFTVTGLPAGLQLSSDGTLSGTPTASGTFHLTLKATDASLTPFAATATYTLNVAAPTLVMTSTPLPQAQVAATYRQQLTVTGGTAPYRNFMIVSPGLPAGLTLLSTGLITGTPTAGGTFTFTVRATDSTTGLGPYSTNQTYSLTVTPPTIVISTTSLPAAQLGITYTQTVHATGGTGAHHFSVFSGKLPTGITLNTSTGALTGKPTVAGTYDFVIRVADSSTGTGPYSTTQALEVVVQQPTTISYVAPLSGETSGAVDAFQVLVLDQYGNPYNGPVTLTAKLVANGTTVPFTTSSVTKVTAVNGVATFTNVTINTRSVTLKGLQQYQLKATAGAVTVLSNPFAAGTSGRLP
jgi:hypothetical protein